MSTVYVLGAGASFDAGYPLCSDLGGRLLTFMSMSKEPAFQGTSEFFQEEFGVNPNLEEMITNIQSLIKKFENSTCKEERDERSSCGQYLERLTRALPCFFAEIRAKHIGSYAEFAKQVVLSGDTVITFNYDDSLEYELRHAGKWDIATGYGFPLGVEQTPSGVTLLKLHGSVNWRISLLNGATAGELLIDPLNSMGDAPVIDQNDLKFLGYEEFAGRVYKEGYTIPCLILPGRSKEFYYDTSFGREFSDFWKRLWQQAKLALANCQKVVFCGYSLPSADIEACQMLFECVSKTTPVEIVCGSQTENIAKEFSDLGFSEVRGASEKLFSDWVKKQLR